MPSLAAAGRVVTRLAAPLCILLAVGAAAVDATASPRSAATLTVSARLVSGRLAVSGSTTASTATVSVKGKLRVRRSGVRLVVIRCANARCKAPIGRERASVLLARGARTLRRSLHVSRAPVLMVQVRVNGRVIASRALVPSSVPQVLPKPAPPGAVGPAPSSESAPPALAVATDPPLSPAYDEQITDYTVRCRPQDPVALSLDIPAGTSARINGVVQQASRVRSGVSLGVGERMALSIDDASGSHTANIRCVPADMPSWAVERAGPPQTPLIVFAPSLGGGGPYSVIADDRGVPLWWIRAPQGDPIDTKVIGDTVLWARSGADEPGYDRVRLDGGSRSPVVARDPVGLDPHDLIPDGAGGWYGISDVPREHVDLGPLAGPADATVLEGQIVHLDSRGVIDWRWRTQDHIGLDETSDWGDAAVTRVDYEGQTAYDIIHMNSIELDGDGIVFSARHLDAVYRIRLADGTIDWKLGGTNRIESLAILGDPLAVSSFGGQHDARVLPDGTLTLHDNGTRRGRPPRALRYRLDLATRSATLLEQVTDGRIAASPCCGSARRLDGGDWLMSWGGTSTVTELTPGGQPVLTLQMNAPTFSYRAVPWNGPAGGIGELRQAMDSVAARGLAG